MAFIESEHPRAGNGRFTDKNKEEETKKYNNMTSEELREQIMQDEEEYEQVDISGLLGREYKGYKGQAAVDKLMQERKGHVKGAFHRDDIGDIDLLWGNESMGLQHILQRREAQGIDSLSFIQDIAEVTEKGVFHKKNDRGNFEFWHKGKMVVVAPEFHGNKLTFVLTAYKRTKK